MRAIGIQCKIRGKVFYHRIFLNPGKKQEEFIRGEEISLVNLETGCHVVQVSTEVGRISRDSQH